MARLSPSIGVAWDPFKNGKQAIRADYRLSYDRMNAFVLSSSVFQGLPGETFPVNDTSFAGQRVSAGIPTLTPPTETPLSLRQPAPFSTTSVTAIDPNWKPAQVHEWSLGVQRQVGSEMVAEVAYVGKHAVHLFGGYDANQAIYQSNGFLDAFKTVAAGKDSPLVDKIVGTDRGFQQVLAGGLRPLVWACSLTRAIPAPLLPTLRISASAALPLWLPTSARLLLPRHISSRCCRPSPSFFFRYPGFVAFQEFYFYGSFAVAVPRRGLQYLQQSAIWTTDKPELHEHHQLQRNDQPEEWASGAARGA